MFSRAPAPDLEVTPATADLGNAEVQFGMGLKFANGEGTLRDYVQAAEWYRKAADQSHSLAQFNLGTMYASGHGMVRDDAQSRIWFGKAARQGDAGAQFQLGASCHRASFGREVKGALESRIEAYKWYHLAAAQGYKGADGACTNLVLNMTRADIAVGDQRVAAFELDQPVPAQD